MRIGGNELLLTWEDVADALRPVRAEPMPSGAASVEMLGTQFPVTQVITVSTRWAPGSFTEVEGMNALTKIGFTCWSDGRVWQLDDEETDRFARPPGSATRDTAHLYDRLALDGRSLDEDEALPEQLQAMQRALASLETTVFELTQRVEAIEDAT